MNTLEQTLYEVIRKQVKRPNGWNIPEFEREVIATVEKHFNIV